MFVSGRRRRLVTTTSAVSEYAYALNVYDLFLCLLQQGKQAVIAAAAGHNQPALQPVGAQIGPVGLHARPGGQQQPCSCLGLVSSMPPMCHGPGISHGPSISLVNPKVTTTAGTRFHTG